MHRGTRTQAGQEAPSTGRGTLATMEVGSSVAASGSGHRTRRRRVALALTAGVLTGLGTGCSNILAANTNQYPVKDAAHGGRTLVAITTSGFAPSELRVPLGSSLAITNETGETQQVVATDGAFSSGPIAEGTGVVLTMTTAGTFPVTSPDDPALHGTIVVTPSRS
jgi:plastocyanin